MNFLSNEFFAVTARGMEELSAKELSTLGATEVTPVYAGVKFKADLKVLFRLQLGVRTVSRILMPLRDFSASTPFMLYDQLHRMKWEELLTPEKTFAVHCTIAGAKSLGKKTDSQESSDESLSSRTPQRRGAVPRGTRPATRTPERNSDRSSSHSQLSHSHYASLKIKDAIVDRLRLKYGSRPNVDTENPDVSIFAFVYGGRCTLSLDFSGHSLHMRGYRKDGGLAPLRETLASAIIELSEWDGKKPFFDPMCGSGTLPLEAALKAYDIAPGYLYTQRYSGAKWGFMGLPWFKEPKNQSLWKNAISEAQRVADRKSKTQIEIYGSDRDSNMLKTAQTNARNCRLEEKIKFTSGDFLKISAPPTSTPGVLILNPPYGERLEKSVDLNKMKDFYKEIGDVFKQKFKGWTAFVFTGNLEAAKFVGLKPSRRYPLYNGSIECRLLKFDLY